MTSSPSSYSLHEIAKRFGGDVIGDAEVRVASVATLENAGPGAITFLANERYLKQLGATRATAVIVGRDAQDATSTPRIVCENPYAYFARVSAMLNPARAPRAGAHPTAVVHPDARVHPSAEIGAHAVIGARTEICENVLIGAGVRLGDGVKIGRDSRVNAAVTVYDGCTIGERCIVHSGVVIGADGFGLAFEGGSWLRVPQIGSVRIGNDVDIGANTTIDRGAIDDTVIEDDVKLDNQIQIAHNVKIGAHTAIAACTGIAGSTQIGRYCRIGGFVGMAGHLRIADNVEISGHTPITRSIDAPGTYSGVYPFEANRDWRRNAAQLRHLAELAKRVAALERTIQALKGDSSK